MAIVGLISSCIFVLDRVSKHMALVGLTLGDRVMVWPGVLALQLTRNSGMALGILAGNGMASLVLPVMAVGFGWLVLRRYRVTKFTLSAVALVLGGFFGNILDRLTVGYVVDMIFFPWMPWYICNVADIAICVGVGLLACSLLFRPMDWQLKTEATTDEPHQPNRDA